MGKSSIQVACTEHTLYCKVEGMGSMKNSSPLRDFSEHVFEEGCCKFVVDLSGCTGMDSTFMGTLLGIALLKGLNSHSPQVLVVNASKENLKLLDGLGVTQIIQVSKEEVTFPSIQLTELDEKNTSQREKIQTIYEAHKNLVEFDPQNAKKFGKFLKSLLKDLS